MNSGSGGYTYKTQIKNYYYQYRRRDDSFFPTKVSACQPNTL